MDITNPSPLVQEKIIPYQKFDGKYLDILYQIPDILTRTEKAVLKTLNGYAFKDGHCYPRRSTLAQKVGVTVRTISRVIKSLVGKGFLAVDAPALLERHLFQKTNRYHFLMHPAYGVSPETTPEASPEKAPRSLYNINQQSNNKPAGPGVAGVAEKIEQLVSPSGSRFSPRAFLFKHLREYGSEAVEVSLANMLDRMQERPAEIGTTEWWGVGVDFLRCNRAVSEPVCSPDDILGTERKPPDRLTDMLRNIVQKF